MRRARLGAYSLWQMFDYIRHRGIPLLLIGALFVTQLVLAIRPRPNPGGRPPRSPPEELVSGISWSVFWSFAFLAVILTVNGMVSTDRKEGYYRFLFSKPVGIPAYYSIAFAIGLLGVLAVSLLMYLGIWWATGSRMPVHVFAAVPLLYALLGALGFLLSTVMNREWLGIVGIIALAAYLQHRAEHHGGAIEIIARYLLPPFHLGDTIRDSVMAGTFPASSVMLWPVAYGAVLLAAALSILRRRAMA